MSEQAIVLTHHDHARLLSMVERMRRQADPDMARILSQLSRELDRAAKASSAEMPADVVTMDSEVAFRDIRTGERLQYRVTWPEASDPQAGRISVLAPIGMALLGCRAGQIVEWEVPAGKRRFLVEKVVYQPEASGAVEA